MKEIIAFIDNIGDAFSGTYNSKNNSFNEIKESLYDSFSHISNYHNDKDNMKKDMKNVLGDLNKAVISKK